MNNIGRWVAVLLAAALPCVVWANPISLGDLLWPLISLLIGISLLQALIAAVEALAYSGIMKDEFIGWLPVSLTANLTSFFAGLAVFGALNPSPLIKYPVVILLLTSVAIVVEVPLIVLLTWKFWSQDRERRLLRVVWMVALVNLVSCSAVNAIFMSFRAA